MAKKKESGQGIFGCLWTSIKWIFAIAFWPITLLYLIGKHFGNGEKKKE